MNHYRKSTLSYLMIFMFIFIGFNSITPINVNSSSNMLKMMPAPRPGANGSSVRDRGAK